MITQDYREGIDHALKRIRETPDIAVILGSGLGYFATQLQDKRAIDTHTIPGHPLTTVEGHAGKIVFGKSGPARILCFQGRIHYYEFGTFDGALFPVLLSHQLGVKRLVITNAAGAINRHFSPRELMLIVDHINFMLEHPLHELQLPTVKHRNSPYYSPALAQIAEEAAKSISVTLRSGVYCAVKGPSYETPAEVEMLFRLGADAVGMSTVPEVTLAHRLGIEVLGLSLISNMATGITRTKQLHDDVTRTARVGARNLTALLQQIISRLHN